MPCSMSNAPPPRNGYMRIYFCPECGGYSLGPASQCDECQAVLPEDSWADISEEELSQLEYIEDLELPPGMPTWEYEVVKLSTASGVNGISYSTGVLKRMGEKGWELINILPGEDSGVLRYGVFKRSWAPDYEE